MAFSLKIFNLDTKGWECSKDIAVVGTAWQGGQMLTTNELFQNTQELRSKGANHLKKFVSNLDGFFAIVAIIDDKTAMISGDLIRSIPVFYGQKTKSSEVCITNEPELLLDEWGQIETDRITSAEFRLCGYVTGNETLDRRIFQSRAGCFTDLKLKENGEYISKQTQYFSFLPAEKQSKIQTKTMKKIDAAWRQSIAQLIEYANGKQIVIPLSGGYDSRLILVSLVEAGYKNIVTFTYGSHDQDEKEISKSIAGSLNVPWHFVEYTNERWREWRQSNEFAEFFTYSRKACSTPHIQDVIAIKALLDEGKIKQSSIVVPGHSGDFVAGSHLPKTYLDVEWVSNQLFLENYWRKHYHYWPKLSFDNDVASLIEKRILKQSKFNDGDSSLVACSLHDRWDLEERQAKFVVNSVRTYEFYGLDWWIPMFNKSFTNVWREIAIEDRIGQSVYNNFVIQKYAEVAGVSLEQSKQSDKDQLIHKLRRLLLKFPLVAIVAGKLYDKVKVHRKYHNDPFRFFGIVDEAEFSSYYTGRETVNSFMSRRAIDELIEKHATK